MNRIVSSDFVKEFADIGYTTLVHRHCSVAGIQVPDKFVTRVDVGDLESGCRRKPNKLMLVKSYCVHPIGAIGRGDLTEPMLASCMAIKRSKRRVQ